MTAKAQQQPIKQVTSSPFSLTLNNVLQHQFLFILGAGSKYDLRFGSRPDHVYIVSGVEFGG